MAEAWDFAVTSGMQSEWLQRPADSVADIHEEYALRKREFQNTEAECSANRLRFRPLVIEAHGGGLSPDFRRAIDFLARRTSSMSPTCTESPSLRLAQRITLRLYAENGLGDPLRLVWGRRPGWRTTWRSGASVSGGAWGGSGPLQSGSSHRGRRRIHLAR